MPAASVSDSKIQIVGAGLSGLTLAYFLVKNGQAVEIYDKADSVGGLIRTEIRSGMQVEAAANGFLANALIESLASDIGVTLLAAQPAAKKRFIYWRGLRQWPLGLGQSLRMLLLIFKFFFFRETLRPLRHETVRDWARRQVGDFLAEQMLQPALQGIYAGDVDQLSATLIFGPLLFPEGGRAPKGQLRGTVAPAEGMQEFARKLSIWLQAHGVKIHLNQELQDLSLRPLVFATAQPALRELMQGLKLESPKAQMIPVIRATAGFANPQKTLAGFGALFASGQGYRALGVLSNSEIFAHRGSLHNETWMFGGAKDPQAIELSDQEVHQLIKKERLQLLRDDTAVQDLVVVRWPQALPHYTVDYERALHDFAPLRAKLESEGLFLTGNHLGQLGLSRIVAFNQELAKRISTYVQSGHSR